jgi:hypothetical protein
MLILERQIKTIKSLDGFDFSLVENLTWLVPLLPHIFTIPTSYLLF